MSGVGSGYYMGRFKRPDLLIGLYTLFLAAAQIIAVKIITVGPFIVPASVFIYPFTLLLNCIVEFFGKQEAYRAVGVCFNSLRPSSVTSRKLRKFFIRILSVSYHLPNFMIAKISDRKKTR